MRRGGGKNSRVCPHISRLVITLPESISRHKTGVVPCWTLILSNGYSGVCVVIPGMVGILRRAGIMNMTGHHTLGRPHPVVARGHSSPHSSRPSLLTLGPHHPSKPQTVSAGKRSCVRLLAVMTSDKFGDTLKTPTSDNSAVLSLYVQLPLILK